MYDPDKNIKFASYAVPWIKGYIMTQINQCGQRIRVSRSHKDISGILYKMGYEVPLTVYEMDEVLEKYPNISREQLLSYTDITVISAEAPIQSVDNDNLSIVDNIADTNSMADFDAIDLDDIEEIIDMILLYIKASHRDLVEEWMYATLEGFRITNQQLGKKYGISKSYVSRILNTAINICKAHRNEILEILA